jgi:predicted transcriptional regulator
MIYKITDWFNQIIQSMKNKVSEEIGDITNLLQELAID